MGEIKKGKVYILKAGGRADHQLGSISRDEDDLFHVQMVGEDECIGIFVCGYGFMNVKVNPEDLRKITQKEWEEKWSKRSFRLASNPPIPFREDEFDIEKEILEYTF